MIISRKHDCAKELKKADLKSTPNRLAVLRLLEKSNKPIDVAFVRSYLKEHRVKSDPATIFRIMNLFTKRGLIKEIYFNEGKTRYELSSKKDHHHLICQNCRKIEDVSNCSLEFFEKEIRAKKGFLVKNHSLEFFGICANCQK